MRIGRANALSVAAVLTVALVAGCGDSDDDCFDDAAGGMPATVAVAEGGQVLAAAEGAVFAKGGRGSSSRSKSSRSKRVRVDVDDCD